MPGRKLLGSQAHLGQDFFLEVARGPLGAEIFASEERPGSADFKSLGPRILASGIFYRKDAPGGMFFGHVPRHQIDKQALAHTFGDPSIKEKALHAPNQKALEPGLAPALAGSEQLVAFGRILPLQAEPLRTKVVRYAYRSQVPKDGRGLTRRVWRLPDSDPEPVAKQVTYSEFVAVHTGFQKK